MTQILAGPGNLVQNLAYQYDSLGNLLSRQDGNQNQVENFLYDGLNRLIDENLQGTGITGILVKSYTYDALGNLRYKSDVGTYSYGEKGEKGTHTFYDAILDACRGLLARSFPAFPTTSLSAATAARMFSLATRIAQPIGDG